MNKRLSFIHGFQDGVLGILPQSKLPEYLDGHAMGAETLSELREAAKDKYPVDGAK